jgi:hypothetical protein
LSVVILGKTIVELGKDTGMTIHSISIVLHHTWHGLVSMDSGLIAEQAITSTPLLLKGPSLLKGCPQSTQGASSSHRAEKFTKAKSETKHASCATFLDKKRNIC